MTDDSSSGSNPSRERRPVLRAIRLVANVVFFYVVFIEITLMIAFVCLLFGLEPSTWFVDWVYRSVERTMQPFTGFFTAIEFGSGDEVEPTIESAIPFAMIVYGIIALAAHDLAEWIGRPDGASGPQAG